MIARQPFVANGYPSLRFPNMVKVNIHEHWTRVTRFNPLWVSDIICEKFQVAALLLLILTLTEPPNTWKSEYLFLGRYTVDLFTHFKARPISQMYSVRYPQLTMMTSVSVRFEEMTASHRFELQSETKDDHQQSRKLRKCLSRSRCRKPKTVFF